jgi:hypothetical protein
MTPGSAGARIENETECGAEELSETAAAVDEDEADIANFLGK